LRGATPPARNTLSHANKIRDYRMAEQLFWAVLEDLQRTRPGFRQGRTRGMAWRFRRAIHVVDATVIQLVASCLDWAEHNHRKAAAEVPPAPVPAQPAAGFRRRGLRPRQ